MAGDTPDNVPEHRHIDFRPNQVKLIKRMVQDALKEV
jgi:hypothetical protein